VSECDREASIMRRPSPLGAVAPLKKKEQVVTESNQLPNIIDRLACDACADVAAERPIFTFQCSAQWARACENLAKIVFSSVVTILLNEVIATGSRVSELTFI
jgi:hypothetical protein